VRWREVRANARWPRRGHAAAANALPAVSSALVDALGLLLIGRWLFRASPRPFAGMIWHHPGVPSLFVTYDVANDDCFSGHTAIATLGALDLARVRKGWVTAQVVPVVVFEASAVIVLRAHYTMDVFTGLVTALCVSHFTSRIWPEARS